MKQTWWCGLMAGALVLPVWAGDQPQWGEAWSRNMVSTETGLPDSFDPQSGRNVKWVAQLGTETHSTPVIAGGRVYIGTNNGEPRDPKHRGDRGVVMCFEEATGKLLWQLVVPKREEDPYFDWPKCGVSSSVTVEGDRVYVVSNRGELMCLDVRGMANGNDGPYRDEGMHMTPPSGSGAPPRPVAGADIQPVLQQPRPDGFALQPGPLDADILWLFDLASGAGIWPHDGSHSGILIHGDHLYLNSGTGVDNTHKRIRTPDAPSLLVFDKRTGQLLARDDEHIAPNIFHCTWSAPSLGVVNEKPLIFFCGGNGVVYAFEPLPSQNLREPANAGNAPLTRPSDTLSPTGGEGRVRGRLASAPSRGDVGGGASVPASRSGPVAKLKKVWQFDFDPTAPKENVHQYNRNRREGPSNFYGMPVFLQNRVFAAGGGDIFWGKNEAWLKCIDATKSGDVTQTALVWSYALEKHVLSTPAMQDGLAFIADCGRKFHCVNAETGQPYWTHDIAGDVWASPMVADGKVYLGTRAGHFYVFAARREKKVLSTLELVTPISGTVTAANGVLYLATMGKLYALKTGATWDASR